MKGFSKRNLELIRQWHVFYSQKNLIAKQAVSQLVRIPWEHNIVITSKCKKLDEAFFYGILICKSKNDTVVEYALKDVHKPIGVSEYIIAKNLLDEFKSSLPSIEEIEAELSGRENA